MTGKEALEQLRRKHSKYIVEWYYMSNMGKQERDRLCKMYDEEIKIIGDELEKYKKTFELLKQTFYLDKCGSIYGDETYYRLYLIGDYPDKDYLTLTKEQFELLEELIL